MKFDFHKFLAIVATVGPGVLLLTGGGAIAPLVPVIIHAIGEAEAIKGATAAQKKAHVLAIVEASVATANATGKVQLDLPEVLAVSSTGIDTVIGTVNIVAKAKPPKVT